jgi:hypothetical protein
MPLDHAQAVSVLFPRWKTTAELLKFWDEVLRVFPLEDVRAAAKAHRINRGKADDPDLKDVEMWCRNRRTEKVVTQKHQAAAPKPDVWTEEDRQWCAMMDLWRADFREANPSNALQWVSDAFGAAARDLAKFKITDPNSVRGFLRRIARDCGAKIAGTDTEAGKVGASAQAAKEAA